MLTPVDRRAAEALAWLEPHADAMAELVVELVGLDTENPPGRGLGRFARSLQGTMEALGCSPEIVEVASHAALEDPCVVIGSVGDGAGTIYFHGHFDVVPAQSRDQFRPVRAGRTITGRGSADMKGGLVSMLYGAIAARELGLLEDRRVVLHFVCDEETGGHAGSGHLRDHELIDSGALAMVTAEPTAPVVWSACRGAITMRVHVRGREAHVGQAHRGINAFEHATRIAEPLHRLAAELRERQTAIPMDDDDAAGSMLVVGGQARAGANFNVVPGEAWFSLDLRFNPEEELDAMLGLLRRTVEEAAAEIGADVTIDVLQAEPAAVTDVESPTALALARSIEAVEGTPAPFVLSPGNVDIRFYAQRGIPAFAYGPGRLDVSHGPNERVSEDALLRCAAVYAVFAGAVGS
jgi:acetylornithine deacetylase/succinyl-diaminopimelate desuccinylase-like protein